MTDSKTAFEQLVIERAGQFERLFSQQVWKAGLLPWLKEQRELKIRALLSAEDHMKADMHRGFILALENLINLPGAIDSYRQQHKGKPELPVEREYITDYQDAMPDYPVIDESVE